MFAVTMAGLCLTCSRFLCDVRPLIAVTSAPCWSIVVIRDHIPSSLQRILGLLQLGPQYGVPRVYQLQRPELRLVSYSRVATSVEENIDDGMTSRLPVGLVKCVDVADGLVKR